jgi:hypothetical protein
MLKHHGQFFLAQVYFARYYAVRVQDKALFERTLAEVLQSDPARIQEACLINRMMQRRARELLKQIEDLFL